MQGAVIRWAGLATLLFAAALVLEFISGHVVRVWADDIGTTLTRIDARRSLYLFHTLFGLVLPLFLIPPTLGLFLLFRPVSRPSAVLLCVCVAAAVLLMVASAVFELALARIAADYVHAEGVRRAALLRHGAQVDRVSVGLGTAGFVLLAVPTVIAGLLTLRSRCFPRWLGWLAVGSVLVATPGLLGFVAEPFFGFHLVAYLGQILWLCGVGWVMWRGAMRRPSPVRV
jgi:hypothetical protein